MLQDVKGRAALLALDIDLLAIHHLE